MGNSRNLRDPGFGATDATRAPNKVRSGPTLKAYVSKGSASRLGNELGKASPGAAGQQTDGNVMGIMTQAKAEPRKLNWAESALDKFTDIASYIPIAGPLIKFARKASANEGSKYHMGGGNYASNFVKHGLGAAAEVGLGLVGGHLLGKAAGVAGKAVSGMGGKIASRVAAKGAFSPAIQRMTDVARAGASNVADVASKVMGGAGRVSHGVSTVVRQEQIRAAARAANAAANKAATEGMRAGTLFGGAPAAPSVDYTRNIVGGLERAGYL
jgi:hypothetical protein